MRVLSARMQRCADWEETGRRIFAKRNSGVRFERALAAASEAQARASAQLDNLQVNPFTASRNFSVNPPYKKGKSVSRGDMEPAEWQPGEFADESGFQGFRGQWAPT